MSEQFKSIETTELVKIANAIRTKTGTTDKISLEDMPAKIAAIESGVTLPELENEGSNSDLMEGKELIDNEGNKVTGTMPTAAQAIPSITVNSSGLITATATQITGYVAAGTKSATKQLAFQAAKTITPTTTDQIAISSGYYTGGNVTVAGDANLVPENIAEGVTIFGVTGTHSEGSSASGSIPTCTIIVQAGSYNSYGIPVVPVYRNGAVSIEPLGVSYTSDIVIEDVICGAPIDIGDDILGLSFSDNVGHVNTTLGYYPVEYLIAPTTAGDTGTIYYCSDRREEE